MREVDESKILHSDIFDGLHPKPEDHVLNQQDIKIQKNQQPEGPQAPEVPQRKPIIPNHDFHYRPLIEE